MQFIGIDLHTNRFTCCYRDEDPPVDGKRTETFELSAYGLSQFYTTLTKETYVLLEATITTFPFARLIQPMVKEVIVANTYELKQISLGRNKTDKIDADKLCRILKMQVLSGEKTISPVTIPPEEIQELRGLFSTYRLLKKQTTQLKNRIHSLLKEKLHGSTQEQISGKSSRKTLREMEGDPVLSFQINHLFGLLENMEAGIDVLEDKIKERAEPFMREIQMLTSMKGISVFIAIAIIADIITVDRFKDSKSFTSYLRSAPRVESSNTSKGNKGTNKMGRKLSATFLTQILNHVLDASPKLERWYARLTQYKKPGSVRTALRRRVFAEIYQMLKKGEYHYGRDPKKHDEKIVQYKRFLEKRKNLLKSA
jgi:transposase